MKFIVSWKMSTGTYNDTVSRFLQTGGAPDQGVHLIGRWHGMSGGGVAIVESDDPKAIYAWQARWADVLSLDVTPCLDDAEAGEVLAAVKG